MTELNVLVIEDDDLLRKSLYDTLNKWGHNVRAADSLTDAREHISGGGYDVVFLDVCLPDGDGLKVLEEEESFNDEGANVVVMTAFADVRNAVKAIKLGAYDYLAKPFEKEQLEKVIRNIANKVELSQAVESLSRFTIGEEHVWQFDEMIGTEPLNEIFEKARQLADYTDTTVLILGESGTGKGMLAKAIHRLSQKSDKPFIDINCSAIPAQLMESEIFGYEKGAFTDAKNSKPGLLEIANKGTVFLDEIGDMDLNLQGKMLKVIEDKSFRRLGSSRTTTVDVRIIAATNRDLKKMAEEGKFREDLYYRLSVIPIELPPLREHKKSIMPIARYYVEHFCRKSGSNLKHFSSGACEAMLTYSWPGNVRELRNAVERGVILSKGDEIDEKSLGLFEVTGRSESDGACSTSSDTSSELEGGEGYMPPMSLAECEKRLICSVLESVNGNRNKAAEVIQIHRTTLYKKMQEYGIT